MDLAHCCTSCSVMLHNFDLFRCSDHIGCEYDSLCVDLHGDKYDVHNDVRKYVNNSVQLEFFRSKSSDVHRTIIQSSLRGSTDLYELICCCCQLRRIKNKSEKHPQNKFQKISFISLSVKYI